MIRHRNTFTPRELFSRMQGAWFEPRQGSMWQENTGVTPTTSGGQTIGKLVDLSAGRVASQATAANRPLFGARRNLLTYSEDFSNPVWVAVFGVLTNNAASAPDGTLTAALHTHNQQYSSLLYVYYNFTVGNTYTVSFWARRSSGANTLSVFSGSTNNVIGTFTPTQTWTKYSFSFTALGTFDEIYFAQDRNDSGFTTVELWHPQLELGSVATDYQRVTTATDYDPGPYPALAHDSTDSLVVTLPDLGGGVFSSAGSVYFATSVGMSCLHNQSIGTSYNLPALQTDIYGTVITPARLAPPLEKRLELYMLRLAGLIEPDYLLDDAGDTLMTDDNEFLLRA